MSRYHILKKLQEQEGAFLSGEALSRELGITRAAVWKGIEGLRKDGYEIESKTRMGYRLLAAPEHLSADSIRSHLHTQVVGRTILCFDTLGSTNTFAKKQAAEGCEDGLVILADQQTGGRGRCGRTFESPSGKGVYLTALLRPNAAQMDVLPITALAAVAVCNAVEHVCGVRPGIKWTNDLVLNGKKLAGILTEMGIEGESGRLEYVAIGIGINVNHQKTDFGAAVAELATSLSMELGQTISRSALAVALIEELDQMYAKLGKAFSEELAAYRRDCVTLGKEVRILGSGAERRAYALEIDDQFALVVRNEKGERETIQSGEVSVRGLYGYL